jgi:hypothetical protein
MTASGDERCGGAQVFQQIPANLVSLAGRLKIDATKDG